MARGERMRAEMAEQPDVLARLAARVEELREPVRRLTPRPLAGIALVARGSSDHAAVYGRYLLEPALGRPVSLAAASLHTLYRARVDYTGYLVISISQSGETPEIVTVTERLRAAGARTIAVTNETGSSLARGADLALELGASAELAVPATKTFTAEVMALALLAAALSDDAALERRELERAAEAVARVLDSPAPAERLAARWASTERLYCTGRGYLFAAALEAALKLKEVALVLAEGYSAADLRHGPIALAARGFPVLALSAPGPAARDMEELVGDLRAAGADVTVAAPDGEAELPLPTGLPEPLMPLPAVVRAQQLALALALERGLDPDAPEGLHKVTRTV
jgi:glutamine---fructose-6-phosphate transaminase (isomerizing)